MESMLKKATNDELYKLMDALYESGDITDNQAVILLAIVEELVERGEMPQITDEDVSAALEKSHAMIAAGRADDLDTHEDTSWLNRALSAAVAERQARRRRFLRNGVAVASIIVVITLVNAGTALAFHRNFLGEFFQFTGQALYTWVSGEPDSGTDLDLIPFITQLDEFNIPVRMITKIPSGFIHSHIEVVYDVEPYKLSAWFAGISSERSFSIDVNGDPHSTKAEANVGTATGTIDHLDFTVAVYQNNSRMKAIWEDNGYRMTIQGDLTFDEIEAMIKSIQE